MIKFEYLKNINWQACVVSLFILGLIVGMGYPGVQVAFAEDTVKAEDAKKEEVEEASNDYTLDEVTVTANRREEKLQDVSVSVTAMNAKMLEDMGTSDLEDYIRSVPGVQFSAANPGSMKLSIRGVRSLDVNPQGGAVVGYYLDEISIPTAFDMPDISTFDMARVEVLRGPQGTLFGEGSLGGTIRSITNKPNFRGFDSQAEASYYSISEGGDGFNLKAMANVPLGEKAAFRVVGFNENRDGYIDNPYLGLEDVNDYEATGARAMFRWMPNEKFDMLATINVRNSEYGGTNYADENLQQESSTRGDGDDEYSMYNLTGTYKLSNFDIISSTSYFDREAVRNMDLPSLIGAANALAFFYNAPVPTFTGLYTENAYNYEMFTQELRLVSTNDNAFQWTAGLFYKNYEKDEMNDGLTTPYTPEVNTALVQMVFGVPNVTESWVLAPNTQVEQIALFGEASYDITDKVEILAGLRLFKEEQDIFVKNYGLFMIAQGIAEETTEMSETYNVVNPKLTLSYKFTDNFLTYFTAAKGFRSGGINDFYPFFPGSNKTFDPEELWSYELGTKTVWMDGKAIVNGSIFYLDWTDMIAITDTDATGSFVLMGNIGSARSIGADITASIMPIKGLQLDIGASLLKRETAEEITTWTGTYSKGTDIPGVAEFNYNASISYTGFIGNFTGSVRADYTYTGEADLDFEKTRQLPSYGLLNLSTSLARENWTLVLFANNVTDERARIASYYDATTLTGLGLGSQSLINQPRTIGLTLRYKF